MKRVVVVSGKGGTGKTSLTASLAALARSRAVLVDADVDAPNLALVADAEQIAFQSFTGGEKALIHPEKCQRCLTCVHACRFGAISDHLDYPQVNSVRCEGCKLCARLCLVGAITMEPHVSGFLFTSWTRWNSRLYHGRLLPGGENSGKMVTALREQAEEYGNREKLDFLFVDGAPGIGCPVIASLTGCDLALVVTEPTLSGRHDLERILQLAVHLRVSARVVINKTDLSLENTALIRSFCQEQGVPVLAEIPFSEEVVRSMVMGLSAYEFDPSGVYAEQVKRLWDSLLAEWR